jgi:CheY-like chemotaxis protein
VILSSLLKRRFCVKRITYKIHTRLCLVYYLSQCFSVTAEKPGVLYMGNRRAPAVLEQNTQMQEIILIVEDDPGIGSLLLTALQQETAYDALLVSDGESALHLIATHKPHLVIVDYQLPGMNGLDLVDHIRTMNGLGQVPLLLISANLPQTELTHRHLPGLSKPFEIETLFTVVEYLLFAQAGMRC